jgi:hypothetical protein
MLQACVQKFDVLVKFLKQLNTANSKNFSRRLQAPQSHHTTPHHTTPHHTVGFFPLPLSSGRSQCHWTTQRSSDLSYSPSPLLTLLVLEALTLTGSAHHIHAEVGAVLVFPAQLSCSDPRSE